MLFKALARLGAPAPVEGLAALRFWGQTGERSGAWMAAADPVHLETRLHSLRLRALRPDELSGSELGVLFDHLQATLGGDKKISLTRLGHCGYLRCVEAVGSAPISAAVLHGLPPDECVPEGSSASAYHQLLSEIQMALHEHDVNNRRAAAGKPEINSLWLWGGGVAPDAESITMPLLIADDPLFRGYWHSCNGDGKDWDGGIDSKTSNFVAVVPDLPPDDAALAMIEGLNRVREMLARGTISSATLLFRDGLSVDINRADAYRFWRGESPLLTKNETND